MLKFVPDKLLLVSLQMPENILPGILNYVRPVPRTKYASLNNCAVVSTNRHLPWICN